MNGQPPTMAWLLEQRDVWWAGDRGLLQLDQMDPRHIANVLSLLRRNATRLYATFEVSPIYRHAPGDVWDGLLDGDQTEWLEDQPLVRRLRVLTGELDPADETDDY